MMFWKVKHWFYFLVRIVKKTRIGTMYNNNFPENTRFDRKKIVSCLLQVYNDI